MSNVLFQLNHHWQIRIKPCVSSVPYRQCTLATIHSVPATIDKILSCKYLDNEDFRDFSVMFPPSPFPLPLYHHYTDCTFLCDYIVPEAYVPDRDRLLYVAELARTQGWAEQLHLTFRIIASNAIRSTYYSSVFFPSSIFSLSLSLSLSRSFFFFSFSFYSTFHSLRITRFFLLFFLPSSSSISFSFFFSFNWQSGSRLIWNSIEGRGEESSVVLHSR